MSARSSALPLATSSPVRVPGVLVPASGPFGRVREGRGLLVNRRRWEEVQAARAVRKAWRERMRARQGRGVLVLDYTPKSERRPGTQPDAVREVRTPGEPKLPILHLCVHGLRGCATCPEPERVL